MSPKNRSAIISNNDNESLAGGAGIVAIESSAFYPPRARWFSPFFYAGRVLRRRLGVEAIHSRLHIGFRELLLGCLCPGFSFWAAGRNRAMFAVGGAYLLSALVFLVLLGYTVSNLAFGMMISLHVSSILFALRLFLSELTLGRRFLFSLATAGLLGGLVYAQVPHRLEKAGILPLRTNGRVIIARLKRMPQPLKRGVWIVYHGPAAQTRGVMFSEGYGTGPVLAVPGDRVEFTESAFKVNERVYSARQYMPRDGSMVLHENQWLVWPEFDTVRRNNVSDDVISQMVLAKALLAPAQIVGHPFRHWFGRRQLRYEPIRQS